MKHCTFFACWLLRPKLCVARMETEPVRAVCAGAAELVPAVARPPAASPITAAAPTRVRAKALDRMCFPSGWLLRWRHESARRAARAATVVPKVTPRRDVARADLRVR